MDRVGLTHAGIKRKEVKKMAQQVKVILKTMLEMFGMETRPERLWQDGFPVQLYYGKKEIPIRQNGWNDGLGQFYLDRQTGKGETPYLRITCAEMLQKEVLRCRADRHGRLHMAIDVGIIPTIWPTGSGLAKDVDGAEIVKYLCPAVEGIKLAAQLRRWYGIPAYAIMNGVIYDYKKIKESLNFPLCGKLRELWDGGSSIFETEAVTPSQRETLRRIAARMRTTEQTP